MLGSGSGSGSALCGHPRAGGVEDSGPWQSRRKLTAEGSGSGTKGCREEKRRVAELLLDTVRCVHRSYSPRTGTWWGTAGGHQLGKTVGEGQGRGEGGRRSGRRSSEPGAGAGHQAHPSSRNSAWRPIESQYTDRWMGGRRTAISALAGKVHMKNHNPGQAGRTVLGPWCPGIVLTIPLPSVSWDHASPPPPAPVS